MTAITTNTRVRHNHTDNIGTVLQTADALSAYDGDLGPWAFVGFEDGLACWVTTSSLTQLVDLRPSDFDDIIARYDEEITANRCESWDTFRAVADATPQEIMWEIIEMVEREEEGAWAVAEDEMRDALIARVRTFQEELNGRLAIENPAFVENRLTVGRLRELIEGLDDNVSVVIPTDDIEWAHVTLVGVPTGGDCPDFAALTLFPSKTHGFDTRFDC